MGVVDSVPVNGGSVDAIDGLAETQGFEGVLDCLRV